MYHGWKPESVTEMRGVELIYPPGHDEPIRMEFLIPNANTYTEFMGLVKSMYFDKIHDYTVKRKRETDGGAPPPKKQKSGSPKSNSDLDDME